MLSGLLRKTERLGTKLTNQDRVWSVSASQAARSDYRKFTHLLPSPIHYTNTNTLGRLDINYFLIPQVIPSYISRVGMWSYPACLVPRDKPYPAIGLCWGGLAIQVPPFKPNVVYIIVMSFNKHVTNCHQVPYVFYYSIRRSFWNFSILPIYRRGRTWSCDHLFWSIISKVKRHSALSSVNCDEPFSWLPFDCDSQLWVLLTMPPYIFCWWLSNQFDPWQWDITSKNTKIFYLNSKKFKSLLISDKIRNRACN